MKAAHSSNAGIPLHDAHCHLYNAELQAVLSWDTEKEQLPEISSHVINGTHPDDWETVARGVSLGDSRSLPAFGAHPYFISDLPADWESLLVKYLDGGAVSVGEIGLDFWIEPRDESLQREVFMRQMKIAVEKNLPPTIHCVRAYGALLDCLRECTLPGRGFLAHGFGGSREVMYQLLDIGGYVSFSAYGSHPARKRLRDVVRACPADRLLVETDAPHMVPPDAVCRFPLSTPDGKRLHHPAELLTAYEWISGIRNTVVDEFAAQVEQNFKQLFCQP